ncbi:MAG: WYL domain-containing protein [Clostridiales bacterium]|nr:WYL domain-containing protein [Clostridiales bacterium]
MEDSTGLGKMTRILTMYERLQQGEIINKAKLAEEFHVDTRTVQRDIDDLRIYFANKMEFAEPADIVYDRKKNGFYLKEHNDKMTASQLLAICKILLESRAFTKNELDLLLDGLINNCANASDRKTLSQLLANERFHYCELQHHTELIERIWDLGNAVNHQQYLTVTYKKIDGLVKRRLKPVGISFSEFYFYLVAFIETDEKDDKYLSPAIYRIDRIQSYTVEKENFAIPYTERFEEGEFKKRIQFMYGGKLQRIIFKYKGKPLETVLDRFPTAKVLEESDTGSIISIEVYGTGVDFWLKSYGDDVEIISRKILK